MLSVLRNKEVRFLHNVKKAVLNQVTGIDKGTEKYVRILAFKLCQFKIKS